MGSFDCDRPGGVVGGVEGREVRVDARDGREVLVGAGMRMIVPMGEILVVLLGEDTGLPYLQSICTGF